MNQAVAKPERRFPAFAVSRGIGIGRVAFLHGEKRQFYRIDLNAAQVGAELPRLRSAVDEAINQLRKLAANNDGDPNQPVSGIFGVHLLILEESSFIAKIERVIRDQKVNAEWALKTVSDQYVSQQGSITDVHFQEKYLDIDDVAERLLKSLNGSPSAARKTESGAVIVSLELRPSAILELAKNNPAALVTTRGGWTSHTSILAREFKLPMVSGIQNIRQVLSQGDQVIVDGINGQIILNPGTETIDHFRAIGNESSIYDDRPAEIANGTATLDGTEITILANVDLPDAYKIAKGFGAKGIGLFRSESLITRPGTIPSEDEQVSSYRQIADVAGDSGVNIRTFDIGIDQLGDTILSTERNPALGLRSIRLSLSYPTHFRAQIRAILRASVDRKIDIVLPMISGVGEIIRSKAIIDDERNQLVKDGIPTGDPQLGAMIEIPSAILTAREIAQETDFLCLGTNDLVQHLLAVDRDNDSVADCYQTLHPAVIRAISEVLSAAENAHIPVVVCGEMAGSPFYVPLLIGLGARELSMNINSIRQIRHLLSGITLTETANLVEKIKICTTADEIEQYLREHYLEHWSGLFPTGLLNSKHR